MRVITKLKTQWPLQTTTEYKTKIYIKKKSTKIARKKLLKSSGREILHNANCSLKLEIDTIITPYDRFTISRTIGHSFNVADIPRRQQKDTPSTSLYFGQLLSLFTFGGRQGDLSESRVLVNTTTNKTTAMIE